MTTLRRRRTSGALAGLLVMGMLAASCGSSDGSGEDAIDTTAAPDTTTSPATTAGAPTTTTAGGAAGTTAPDLKGQEINVFLIPSPSSSAIQSFIPAFEDKTGVKVNFSETPYGEAHQKQLLSYKQKSGAYDVAQFDNTFLATFGAAGVMTPLDDDLAASPAYDISDFSQGQQDYGKYDGKTLGLTLSTEPMIQWYRTDIYDELGLKPATTWDEYLANAKAVKEAGKGDGAMLGWGPGNTWWWMTLIWSFGGDLYDADLNPTVNTPEAVRATQYMKDMLAFGPDGGKIATAKMPLGTRDITHLAGWWAEFDKTVGDALPAMFTGDKDIQGGLDDLNDKLKPILKAENG